MTFINLLKIKKAKTLKILKTILIVKVVNLVVIKKIGTLLKKMTKNLVVQIKKVIIVHLHPPKVLLNILQVPVHIVLVPHLTNLVVIVLVLVVVQKVLIPRTSLPRTKKNIIHLIHPINIILVKINPIKSGKRKNRRKIKQKKIKQH